MDQNGIWLPILEYANVKKTSISTVRRGIKSGRLKYKEEDGKYLIWTRAEINQNSNHMVLENELLKKEIKQLKEELNDLKMLLAIYEKKEINGQGFHWETLPPLPLELDI